MREKNQRENEDKEDKVLLLSLYNQKLQSQPGRPCESSFFHADSDKREKERDRKHVCTETRWNFQFPICFSHIIQSDFVCRLHPWHQSSVFKKKKKREIYCTLIIYCNPVNSYVSFTFLSFLH